MKLSSDSKIESKESISIIIAIRNGEKSLPRLIDFLISQDYKGSMEFILVDDESTDNTKKLIVEANQRDSRFKYLSSTEGNKNLKYKKKGLDAGILISQYNYLLFRTSHKNYEYLS